MMDNIKKVEIEGEITIKSGDQKMKVSLAEAREIMDNLKQIFEPLAGSTYIPFIGHTNNDFKPPFEVTCSDNVNAGSHMTVDPSFNLRK